MDNTRRFLEDDCPRKVHDFVEKYGDPHVEMGGDSAVEFSIWEVSGEPLIHPTRLLIYNNVMEHRVLYLYVTGDDITHVGVIDPTEWRPQSG